MHYILKCCFHCKAHSTDQTPFTRVFQSGTHFSSELTEAMQIKCLAQGHNIVIQPGIEPPFDVTRNRHLTHMTNMLRRHTQKDMGSRRKGRAATDTTPVVTYIILYYILYYIIILYYK